MSAIAALRADVQAFTKALEERSDPYGSDQPSPIDRPMPAGGSEPIPVPGYPDEYPWYLKPIPVNERNIAHALNDIIVARRPVLARWLYSTWNAQWDDIKDQELRNAIRDGEFGERWLLDWQQSYAKFINTRLVNEWSLASDEAHKLWKLGLRRADVGEYIDNFSYRMEEWIRYRGGELAVNFSQQQHKALNNMLRYHIIQDPISEAELKKRIRPLIGLTQNGERAVRNYRLELEEGGDSPEAIEHKVGNYSSWLRRVRAKRIARTELAFAYNYGGYYTMQDAINGGAFDGPVVKQWYTQEDERTCPFCGPLHEQVIGMEETFPGLTTRLPNVLVPPAHPSCRCIVLYHEQLEKEDDTDE